MLCEQGESGPSRALAGVSDRLLPIDENGDAVEASAFPNSTGPNLFHFFARQDAAQATTVTGCIGLASALFYVKGDYVECLLLFYISLDSLVEYCDSCCPVELRSWHHC